MITPRHTYSDTDIETATNDTVSDTATPEAPAGIGGAARAGLWVSVGLLGASGLGAAYLWRHHHGGWGAVAGALGAGMAQLLFFLIWQTQAAEPAVPAPDGEGAAPARQ